jgi:hypothetical protein
MLTLDDRNIVLALQIKPELCAVSKVAAKTNRRIGGNRSATIQNVGDAARRVRRGRARADWR